MNLHHKKDLTHCTCVCGANSHKYTSVCDTTCDVCGYEREDAVEIHNFVGEDGSFRARCTDCGEENKNKCGENAYWLLSTDDTLYIYGTGAIENYNTGTKRSPWYERYTTIKRVVVEEGITALGTYCFWPVKMNSIELPDGLLKIGDDSFRGCSNLSSIEIPGSVTTIGKNAFLACSELSEVVLHEGLETINENAFNVGNKLKELVVPDSVTTIERSVVLDLYCTLSVSCRFTAEDLSWKTKNLTIREHRYADSTPYESMNDTEHGMECVVCQEVIALGKHVYSADCDITCNDCGYERIVTEHHEFNCLGHCIQCDFYDENEVGNGHVYLKIDSLQHACQTCGRHENHIFVDQEGKPVLTCTICQASNTQKCGENIYYTYTNDGTTLLIYGSGELPNLSQEETAPWETEKNNIGTVVIAEGITAVGSGQFMNYEHLGKVVLSNTVKSIGFEAFSYCENLSEIVAPCSIKDIDDGAFAIIYDKAKFYLKSGTAMHKFVMAKTDKANMMGPRYNWIVSDTLEHEFGDEVICHYCGECYFVANYGRHFFSEEGVCACQTNMYDTIILSEEERTVKITRYHGAQEGSLVVPSTLRMNGKKYTVVEIGEDAYSYCTGFWGNLIIPDTVKIIGARAFKGCDGLGGALTLGDNVEYIGRDAFAYCHLLVGPLVIPDSVKTIGQNAFYTCNKIEEIYIPCSLAGTNLQGLLEEEVIVREHALPADGKYQSVNHEVHSWFCTICEKTVTGAHVFDWEDCDNRDAFISDVTCVAPAKYYKSCICKEVSDLEEDIFERGEPQGHVLDAARVVEGNVLKAYCDREVVTKSGTYICGDIFGLVTLTGDAEKHLYHTGEDILLLASVDQAQGYPYAGQLTDYKWYCGSLNEDGSLASGSYQIASGSDQCTVYSIPAAGTYHYVCEVKCDGYVLRFAISVKVEDSIVITTQPKDVEVMAGGKAVVSVVAEGEGLTYQWKYSTDQGATWKIPAATSAKTAKYSMAVTAKQNGVLVRCDITDVNNVTVSTNPAVITVLGPALEITSQPVDVTAEIGQKAAFQVGTNGENVTYQWYYSMDDGKTWKISTAAAAKTSAFSITAAEKWNGMTLKCEVSDSYGQKVTSECAKLVVKAPLPVPVITKEPSDVTMESGKKASFTVEATGTELTYQWYYSMDGGKTWKVSTAAAAKTATFSITTADKWNGMVLKCEMTDSIGQKATSRLATLTVAQPIPSGPVITKEPSDVTMESSKKASFTVEATGTELTYQWYYSMDGGKTWKVSTAAAAKTKTFSITAADKWNGMVLQCEIIDKNGQKVTTKVAALTVAAPLPAAPVITKEPSNVIMEAGKKASFTVEATGEELIYQWYYSMDGGKTWKISTAAAAKTATFSITAADKWNGMLLKCEIADAFEQKVTTAIVSLTVGVAGPQIVSQPVDSTVASGVKASFTVEASGDGLTYQWYYSMDGGKTWKISTASAALTKSFSITGSAKWNGMLLKCEITDQDGLKITSNVAKLIVE